MPKSQENIPQNESPEIKPLKSFISHKERKIMEERAVHDTGLIRGYKNRMNQLVQAELQPDEKGNYRLVVPKEMLDKFKAEMEHSLFNVEQEKKLKDLLDSLSEVDAGDKEARQKKIKEFADDFTQSSTSILKKQGLDYQALELIKWKSAHLERFLSLWMQGRFGIGGVYEKKPDGSSETLYLNPGDVMKDDDLEYAPAITRALKGPTWGYSGEGSTPCFPIKTREGNEACNDCPSSKTQKLHDEIYRPDIKRPTFEIPRGPRF